jgi:F0F1-type ATP synthase assembly protein I
MVGSALGWVIDRVANLSPLVCSRLWCYYVGGFEEIEFVMRRPLEAAASLSSDSSDLSSRNVKG